MIWPGQAPQHDADHGETDEGHDGARVSLEVARQAAVVADPRERTFHDPALGQDDELVQLGALDDFDDPSAGAGRGACDARPLIAGIGEDALDEGKEAARAVIEHQPCPVAILHVGGAGGSLGKSAALPYTDHSA